MTGALWPSALVAAFFAWHPLRVESVAWAAERKDVLCALFWTLSLWAYAEYVKVDPQPGTRATESRTAGPHLTLPGSLATHHRLRVYLLALFLFALALMAKPMAVTLPFVLLLLDFWPLKRADLNTPRSFPGIWLRLLLEKLPFFALSAVSCLLTLWAQGEAVAALQPWPWSLRIGNALLSYGRYLLKTVWPADLAIIYPLELVLPWAEVASAAIFLAAVSWYAWRVRRERPHLLVGWLWFLGTLVPAIGLVQVGGQAMADRYTYLPSIGLLLAVVFEGWYWAARFQLKPAPAIVAGISLVGCLVVTEHQLRFWRDNETLFSHALAVTTNNPVAHINLGVTFEQQGRRKEAMREYREALRLNPNLAQAHNNLGNLLADDGQSEEALEQYRETLRLRPNSPTAHLDFGLLLVELGRYDEAMGHYQTAARMRFDDPRPAYLMGDSLLRQGRSAEAISHFREALRLDPNDATTLTHLARVLAADTDSRVRDGREAVTLAERANILTGGVQPLILDTLAMAYARSGRFSDAQQTLQQAITRLGTNAEPETAVALKDRLRLYESKQPYCEVFTNAASKHP
jgi:tetratricopeptide (TPR) repeat protein